MLGCDVSRMFHPRVHKLCSPLVGGSWSLVHSGALLCYREEELSPVLVGMGQQHHTLASYLTVRWHTADEPSAESFRHFQERKSANPGI